VESEINLKEKIKQASFTTGVAFTESGTSLEPDEGLRRFLIKTHEAIETDKQHFTEEMFSDVFAFYETGHIAAEALSGSTETLEDAPVMSGLAVFSTVAAVYLLNSLNSQRAAKDNEYKKALLMFVEYEQDLDNSEIDENKEVRRKVAIGKLYDKMRHSGLQFVNLPNESKKFDRPKFRKIASKRGIGEELSLSTIDRVSEFLRKPAQEKVYISACALSHVIYKGDKIADLLGKTVTQYAKNLNPLRVYNVLAKDAVTGVKEGSGLTQDIKKHTKCDDDSSPSPKENNDKPVTPLTLDKIHSVNLSSVHTLGHDWAQKDKDDLIRIIRDHEQHLEGAKRAKRSFYVQSAFMGLQLALIPIKLMNEEYRHTVGMNIYSFLAPLGPLKGFAHEIKEERAKANSKLADKAELLGCIMGIDAETETSEELAELDDEHPDIDEGNGPSIS